VSDRQRPAGVAGAARFAAAMRAADPRLRGGRGPRGWRGPAELARAQAAESRAARAHGGGDEDDRDAALVIEAEAAAAGLLAAVRGAADQAADETAEAAARRILARAQAEASRRRRELLPKRPFEMGVRPATPPLVRERRREGSGSGPAGEDVRLMQRGLSRPGPGGTRSAARCAAARPGTGSRCYRPRYLDTQRLNCASMLRQGSPRIALQSGCSTLPSSCRWSSGPAPDGP